MMLPGLSLYRAPETSVEMKYKKRQPKVVVFIQWAHLRSIK